MTAIFIPDRQAQIAASRVEAECDRSSPIAWLFLAALLVASFLAAGWQGFICWMFVVAVLLVRWLFAKDAAEARRAGAIS